MWPKLLITNINYTVATITNRVSQASTTACLLY